MADKTPVPAQATPVEDGPVNAPLPEQPAPAAPVEAPFAEGDAPAGTPGLDDLEARARHEYGRYVAAQAITVGGALAFTDGAPVPRSHPMVAQWVADGMVRDLEATPA